MLFRQGYLLSEKAFVWNGRGKVDAECDKMKSEPLNKEKNKVMIWKQSLKLIIHWFLTM